MLHDICQQKTEKQGSRSFCVWELQAECRKMLTYPLLSMEVALPRYSFLLLPVPWECYRIIHSQHKWWGKFILCLCSRPTPLSASEDVFIQIYHYVVKHEETSEQPFLMSQHLTVKDKISSAFMITSTEKMAVKWLMCWKISKQFGFLSWRALPRAHIQSLMWVISGVCGCGKERISLEQLHIQKLCIWPMCRWGWVGAGTGNGLWCLHHLMTATIGSPGCLIQQSSWLPDQKHEGDISTGSHTAIWRWGWRCYSAHILK